MRLQSSGVAAQSDAGGADGACQATRHRAVVKCRKRAAGQRSERRPFPESEPANSLRPLSAAFAQIETAQPRAEFGMENPRAAPVRPSWLRRCDCFL